MCRSAARLGFARRFTAYKRQNLLLQSPERLTRLLTNRDRPVQLVVAGKAHPADDEGRRMVREWIDYARQPKVSGRVVFLEDYDLALAAELVQGVDLWINTPRRRQLVAMEQGEAVSGAVNGWIYQAAVKSGRPADHGTPRVTAHHTEALIPLEAQELLWLR